MRIMAPPLPLPDISLAPVASCPGITASTPLMIPAQPKTSFKPISGAIKLQDDNEFFAKHFERLSDLGRGCFGSVILVRSHSSARKAAVKVVDCMREPGQPSSGEGDHRHGREAQA